MKSKKKKTSDPLMDLMKQLMKAGSKMKKVFRIWKFVEWCYKENFMETAIGLLKLNSWIKRCEGLTGEEMIKSGYCYDDDWMVEE